jgi:hypothetical protein
MLRLQILVNTSTQANQEKEVEHNKSLQLTP